MSAPPCWDEKSWRDVQEVERQLQAALAGLRGLVGHDEPDPKSIADAFESIERLASAGAISAAWCED